MHTINWRSIHGNGLMLENLQIAPSGEVRVNWRECIGLCHGDANMVKIYIITIFQLPRPKYISLKIPYFFYDFRLRIKPKLFGMQF